LDSSSSKAVDLGVNRKRLCNFLSYLGKSQNSKLINLVISNILFREHITLINILFAYKFFQFKYPVRHSIMLKMSSLCIVHALTRWLH